MLQIENKRFPTSKTTTGNNSNYKQREKNTQNIKTRMEYMKNTSALTHTTNIMFKKIPSFARLCLVVGVSSTLESTSLKNKTLKLIICYISSCPTKPSKYCWGQQWAPPSWLVNYIGHCLFISLLFLTQLDSAHMQTSAQFKFTLYITND